MSILVDTSFLLAYAFARDSNHVAAVRAVQSLPQETPIITVPVLTELFYMTMVRLNYQRAIQVFSTSRAAFEVVSLSSQDLARMQEIMEQYGDAHFDFTDTAIMALAERLEITQIYTFDRRDFSIFRPKHCDFLKLLP